MTVRVQHALIHADVDDFAHQAAGFGVIADQLAFQRDGQLGNQGRVHEGGFFGVEASLAKLIRLLVARYQTYIIARGHVLRIRHADGKGTARQDILGGLVPSADAHGNLLILADAAPRGVHGVGHAVFIISGQDEHRLRIAKGLCAKALSHMNNLLKG